MRRRHPLAPLLRPRSVALVGASARAGAIGNDMVRGLRDGGFQDEILPDRSEVRPERGYWPRPGMASRTSTMRSRAVATEAVEPEMKTRPEAPIIWELWGRELWGRLT